MDTLEQRLWKLERSVRWYRNCTMGFALCLVAVLSATCAERMEVGEGSDPAAFGKTYDVIRCRRLEVVSKTGPVTMVLDGGSVGIGQGKRMSITGEVEDFVAGDCASLTVRSHEGKDLLALSSNAGEEGGYVSVYNGEGESVVRLHADEYGNGAVGAYSRNGVGRTLQPGP